MARKGRPAATERPSALATATAEGAHLWGSVSGGAVTQVARDWIAINELSVYLAGRLDGSRSEQVALMAPNPAIWNIPSPVKSFIGRERQLRTIREHLARSSSSVLLPDALHGLGGIGKTQLALAYAAKFREDYVLGWWIAAESASSTLASLARLAVLLGSNPALDPQDLAANLSVLLRGYERWVLIFDNAGSAPELSPLLPIGLGGHILITSRSHAWAGIARPIEVRTLPISKAARLLRIRSGDRDVSASERLARELGGLPLALDQAGSYANQCGIGLEEYLEQFIAHPEELLERGEPQSYPSTVARTLSISVDRLTETHLASVLLLEICSVMAPEDLPVDLIFGYQGTLPEPLAEASRNALARNECIGALLMAGLLSRPREGQYWIHRLVQTVIRERLSGPSLVSALDLAAGILQSGLPLDDSRANGSAWRRYIDHAKMVITRCKTIDHITANLVALTMRTGEYLLEHRFGTSDAEVFFQWILDSVPRWGEEGDERVAQAMSGLGRALQVKGSHHAALEFAEGALQARHQLYTGDDPKVASSMTEVATCKYWLGHDDEARILHGEALEMRRRLFNGDHLDIASSLTMLGATYYGLLDYQTAQEFVEEGLSMRRRLGLRHHPEIAESLCDLAANLYWLGQVTAARDAAAEALEIDLRLFKSDHPDVLWCLRTLADATCALGELETAKKTYEIAIAMAARLYEGDHLDLAWAIAGMASAMCASGEIERGRELYEESAAMGERLYGRDHLVRAYCFAGLAGIWARRGEAGRWAEYKRDADDMLHRLARGSIATVVARLDDLAGSP